MLHRAEALGSAARILAAVLMALALVWGAWLLRAQYAAARGSVI
jgi:hypothetical protein